LEKKWHLDRIDVLKELSEEDRAFLMKKAIKKDFEKGCCIFMRGDQGNTIFLIHKGVVKIYDLSESGKESIFWFRYPGEVFGLAEVYGGGVRMCYAEAVEPTSVFVIRRHVLEELLQRNPRIALLIIKILSARLRRLGEAFKTLSVHDLRSRLALLLLNLGNICGVENSDKITIEKKFTHQDMADMIGATRQRVTEALNNFSRDGLIKCDSKKIILLDPKKLSSIIPTLE
jgi:CRP/FNR family transcriptional regulator